MTTSTFDPIRALTVAGPGTTAPPRAPSSRPSHRPARAPRVAAASDQHVLVQDPPAGTTVQLSVGRQLAIRFRPRVGASRWRVADRPQHLVPLASGDHEVCFLVFGGAPGRLRLERADPAGGPVQEVRDVLVVPVGPELTVGVVRTPRSA